MDVKIKQVNRYEITIGDKTYSDFAKGTEWNGMVEFTSPKGKVIVANNAGVFDDFFSRLLSKEGDVSEKDYQVIQASPDLLDAGE